MITGLLSGLVLKLFLIFLPSILMTMSKFEGFTAISLLERRSASRYYIFNFVNVFLANVIAGAAFEQLNSFLNQSPNQYASLSPSLDEVSFFSFFLIPGGSGLKPVIP